MDRFDARAWARIGWLRRLGEVVVDQADLEEQARQLERRAVDADEAVARAVEIRSRPSGTASGARVSGSELRRLRAEADVLIERALAARLEADRAAEPTGGSPAATAPSLPVTTWTRREGPWEQLLAAALDEPASGPGPEPVEPNGDADRTDQAPADRRRPPADRPRSSR